MPMANSRSPAPNTAARVFKIRPTNTRRPRGKALMYGPFSVIQTHDRFREPLGFNAHPAGRKRASPMLLPQRLLRPFAILSGVESPSNRLFGLANGLHEPGTQQRQHRAGTTAHRRKSKSHDFPCRDINRFRSVGEKSRLHSSSHATGLTALGGFL